jgi:hypothetical protein
MGLIMKTIYLWINDFVENKEEIEQQLFYENQQEKIFKVVLVYEESFVWEMGDKSLQVALR